MKKSVVLLAVTMGVVAAIAGATRATAASKARGDRGRVTPGGEVANEVGGAIEGDAPDLDAVRAVKRGEK